MPVDRRHLAPRAVGLERPREHVVGEVELEDLVEPGAQAAVGDAQHRLDAPVEVARHEVGRADDVLGVVVAGLAEAEDPRVLEVATDDRPHGDVLGQAGHAGAQAADAAHDEVDPRARRRRRVELVDHLGVDERVDLHRDLAAGLRLPADELAQLVAQVHRRDEQPAVLARPAVAGEVVEQLREVGAEIGIARQHAEVFVDGRGLRVVVAGADVAVAADAVGLLAHDEQDLGVRLQADEPVHDVRARLLEHAGPFDVGLLVEARLQLDERHDLLARFGRLDERRDDAGFVAAGAVQRLLDREHARVARGLLDERLDRVARTSRTGGAAARRRRASPRRRRCPRRPRAAAASAA